MARNDITGKAIKTSPQNPDYSIGWERAFGKKTAADWVFFCEEHEKLTMEVSEDVLNSKMLLSYREFKELLKI